MQMFSDTNNSGAAEYIVARATYESGVTSRAPLEVAIGALADGRYRRAISLAFEPERVEICKKFLEQAAAVYNIQARPGERIRGFEIQKKRWDFRSKPLDPDHGEIVDRFTFEVKKR
jgi:hypothetical protein